MINSLAPARVAPVFLKGVLLILKNAKLGFVFLNVQLLLIVHLTNQHVFPVFAYHAHQLLLAKILPNNV